VLDLRSGALLDDGVLHGPESGGGASRCADFVVDVLDVVIGSLRGDEELFGDLLRRESSALDHRATQAVLGAAGQGELKPATLSRPQNPAGLSPREVDVLRLVASPYGRHKLPTRSVQRQRLEHFFDVRQSMCNRFYAMVPFPLFLRPAMIASFETGCSRIRTPQAL
jgi:hypothetical protein